MHLVIGALGPAPQASDLTDGAQRPGRCAMGDKGVENSGRELSAASERSSLVSGPLKRVLGGHTDPRWGH